MRFLLVECSVKAERLDQQPLTNLPVREEFMQ